MANQSQTPEKAGWRSGVKHGPQSKFTMSFNSSDIAAYECESPIPVLQQAYMDYERNKRKAIMRRAVSSKHPIEM